MKAVPIDEVLNSIRNVIKNKQQLMHDPLKQEANDRIYELTHCVSDDRFISDTQAFSDSISEKILNDLADIKARLVPNQSQDTQDLKNAIVLHLSGWLNDHLPKMVDHLVKQEMQKMHVKDRNPNS